jgi:hypothetical protein
MRRRTQRVRLATAAVVTGALLVPLIVFTGVGFAKSPSAAQYQYKITICHHTHSTNHPMVTISVSVRAWPAHQRHHDTLGACPPPPPPATTATTTTNAASPSGNSGEDHGKSDQSHGKSDESHGNGHDK